MSDTQKVLNHLKQKRVLDIDTLISSIHVDMDYSDYVQELADAIGINSEDCLEAFQTLEAHERICIMPQMEPHIDFIEVYD